MKCFEMFCKCLLSVFIKLTSRHNLKMKVCWKKNSQFAWKIRTRLDNLEEFDYDSLFKQKNLKKNWEYLRKLLIIQKPRSLVLDLLLTIQMHPSKSVKSTKKQNKYTSRSISTSKQRTLNRKTSTSLKNLKESARLEQHQLQNLTKYGNHLHFKATTI